jgi:hypothetical protein
MAVSKDQILERVTEGYQSLAEALGSFYEQDPDTQGASNRDAWTAKDLTAHIAAWEEVLLRFHIGGEHFAEVIEMPDAVYQVTPFDEVNAHLFEKYDAWSMDEVSEFSRRTHQALLAALLDLPEQTYQKPSQTITALGLDPYPLYEYIAANTYDHYAEHAEYIQARI